MGLRDGSSHSGAVPTGAIQIALTREAPTERCARGRPERALTATCTLEAFPVIPEMVSGLGNAELMKNSAILPESRRRALALEVFPAIPEIGSKLGTSLADEKCAFLPETPVRPVGSRLRAKHRRRGALQSRPNGRGSLSGTLTVVPIIPENASCPAQVRVGRRTAQSFPKFPIALCAHSESDSHDSQKCLHLEHSVVDENRAILPETPRRLIASRPSVRRRLRSLHRIPEIPEIRASLHLNSHTPPDC
jgi:hypothetical protein